MTVYDFAGDSTTTLGASWTVSAGSVWGRIGGKAYRVSGPDGATATVETGKVNHRVGVRIDVVPSGYPALMLSYVDDSNFVWAEVQPNLGVIYRKKVGGVNSDISGATPAGTWVNGDLLEGERLNSNEYRFYRNGALVAQTDTTQTDLPSATKAGMRYGSAGSAGGQRWDDFTTVGAAPPTLTVTAPATVVWPDKIRLAVTLDGAATLLTTIKTRSAGSTAQLVDPTSSVITLTPDFDGGLGIWVFTTTASGSGGTASQDTAVEVVAEFGVVGPAPTFKFFPACQHLVGP